MLAIKAAKSVGATITGVDLITPDITKKENLIITLGYPDFYAVKVLWNHAGDIKTIFEEYGYWKS